MFLATLRRHSYLAAATAFLLAACPGKPQPVTPGGAEFTAATREAFQEAAAATLPAGRQILRIGWRGENGQLQLSGAGAVRLAPPDSLRLDVAATLGLGRSILVMAGDSVWAQPASVVDQILPDRFALWAALGILRAPPGRVGFERAEAGDRVFWRVTDTAGRQTVFELAGGLLAGVTRIENGATTSQLRLSRNPAGEVRRADLVDRGRQFRLQVDVNAREASEAFAPEIWRLRP